MFTGKLEGMSRAEAKSLIENSGSTVSTISKNLNYLVIGQKPKKEKLNKQKALELIISPKKI